MKKAIIAIALIVLCLSGCTSLDLISEILDDTIVKTTDPAQYGEEVE